MKNILSYMTQPCLRKKEIKEQKATRKSSHNLSKHKTKDVTPQFFIKEDCEYLNLSEGVMIMKGEYSMLQVKREKPHKVG